MNPSPESQGLVIPLNSYLCGCCGQQMQIRRVPETDTVPFLVCPSLNCDQAGIRYQLPAVFVAAIGAAAPEKVAVH